jgi:hypothetical protein
MGAGRSRLRSLLRFGPGGPPLTPKQEASMESAELRLEELRASPALREMERDLEMERNTRDVAFEMQISRIGDQIRSRAPPEFVAPIWPPADPANMPILPRRRSGAGLKDEQILQVVAGTADWNLPPAQLQAVRRYVAAWQVWQVPQSHGRSVTFATWPTAAPERTPANRLAGADRGDLP